MNLGYLSIYLGFLQFILTVFCSFQSLSLQLFLLNLFFLLGIIEHVLSEGVYLCLEYFPPELPHSCSILKCRSPLPAHQRLSLTTLSLWPPNTPLWLLHSLVPDKSISGFLLVCCLSPFICELCDGRDVA